MTNQNLDLQKMGFTPLTELEIQKVDGGSMLQTIDSCVGGVGSAFTGTPGNGVENEIIGGTVLTVLTAVVLLCLL